MKKKARSAVRKRMVPRARNVLAAPLAAIAPGELDAQRLAHQLQVHQAELEMQNEALRDARLEHELALARYRGLFDYAPIGYATLAENDVIREVNQTGAWLLGDTRARLVGRNLRDILDRADHATYQIIQACARGAGRRGEGELRVGDRTLLVTATCVAWKEVSELLLAFQDITDRKREAERLARAERALRETARRKDDFLAALSHELRNPLAPIATSLFVLERAEPGSEAAREAQRIIQAQARHLTHLVDDLLDVTRVSRGKIQLRYERLELGALLADALAAQSGSFAERAIELHYHAPEHAVWVDGDRVRLTQVITNVLGNALKFTPRGKQVTVEVRGVADRAVLRVRDTGVGIAPDLLPYVCEPFVQAPQPLHRDAGGLGLGLAMARMLVEQHGGELAVQSEGAGHGTEVVIRLPRCAATSRVTPRSRLDRVRRRRVLVIEDNSPTATALQHALALIGHDVRTACSGREGLDLARGWQPDVVLCDVGLPELDGYGVARAFREDPLLRTTFLVALSGYTQPADLRRARTAGFDRHLAKPAELDALIRVIAAAGPRAGEARAAAQASRAASSASNPEP